MVKLRVSDNLEHRGILYLFNYHDKNYRISNLNSKINQFKSSTPTPIKNAGTTINLKEDKSKKTDKPKKTDKSNKTDKPKKTYRPKKTEVKKPSKIKLTKIIHVNSVYNLKKSTANIFAVPQKLKKKQFTVKSRLYPYSSSGSSSKKSSSESTTNKSINNSLKSANKSSEKSVVKRKVSKYQLLVQPEKAELLNTLLHPKIYLDLYLSDKYPLGRLTIQLFIEACPEIVLQFMRMCTYKMVEKFNILRIFSNLWIEGEISTHPHFLKKPKYEYNMQTFDHGLSAGVFSFTKKYLEGVPKGFIYFTISLKPMSGLNGERIPFGIVTNGLNVLQALNEFGTKSGKPKEKIYIDDCGVQSK